MSIYAVHKLCRQALHDAAFRAAIKRDPAQAIAPWPLTDAERKALLAGDVAKLYAWGAHGYLLAYFVRWDLFGVTEEIYSERIRACSDRRPRI
jgi:hypothetical protein